jgi:hypothetical protein
MKGLVLSILVFSLYVFSVAILSWIIRPKNHTAIFFPAVAIWTFVYFAFYFTTSHNFGWLSASWLCSIRWVDVTYGYVIFLLNCHNFIDVFFGLNSGFSTSLMQELHAAGNCGLTTEEIILRYRRTDGSDVIYSWRLPRLQKTGYLLINAQTGTCALTRKGRAVAVLARELKRFLHLEEGG